MGPVAGGRVQAVLQVRLPMDSCGESCKWLFVPWKAVYSSWQSCTWHAQVGLEERAGPWRAEQGGAEAAGA